VIAASTSAPILAGNRIFNSCLDNAWTPGIGQGQDAAKVEIVREHYQPMISREDHDYRIERFRIADL
jgi:hypothetical protein